MKASTKNGRISWTNEELLKIGRHLIKTHPNKNLANSKDLTEVRASEFIQAMKAVLPANRHRDVAKKISQCRASLLAALRAEQAPTPSRQTSKRLATPVSVAKPVLEQRTVWKDDEWLAVAHRVAQLLPALALLDPAQGRRKPDLSTLTLRTLNEAAKALPKPRQRRFAAMTTARPKLAAAIVTLRKTGAVPLVAAPAVQSRESLAPQNWQELVEAIVQTVTNEYAAAMAPVFETMTRTIAAQVLQQVEARLAGFGKVKPTSPATPSVQPFHVAVVGGARLQVSALAKRFPQLTFSHLDQNNAVASDIGRFDKVIALTKSLTPVSAKKLRAAAGARFLPISGGLPAVKKQVQLLAQGLPA